MALSTDIQIVDFSLEFIPVETRVPLKFGTEVLASVTCARVCVLVENNLGEKVEGWGETHSACNGYGHLKSHMH